MSEKKPKKYKDDSKQQSAMHESVGPFSTKPTHSIDGGNSEKGAPTNGGKVNSPNQGKAL